MKVSLDISYYPIGTEHVPLIFDFIGRLKQYEDLTVQTNGLSTQVFGEYDAVMEILKSEIHKSFELSNSVFVIKIVNIDQSHWK